MIKTWCFALNKGNKVGGIVLDLLKATLNHNLLFCKLKTYGFITNALTFIQSCFSNRHQRTKVGISWVNSKTSTDVRHGSVSGPLFLNIFTNNLFLFRWTYHTLQLWQYHAFSRQNGNIVISILRYDFPIRSEWFYEHCMVFNSDRCHFLTVGFNEPFPDFHLFTSKACDARIDGITLILNTPWFSIIILWYASRLKRENNSPALPKHFINQSI